MNIPTGTDYLFTLNFADGQLVFAQDEDLKCTLKELIWGIWKANQPFINKIPTH